MLYSLLALLLLLHCVFRENKWLWC